MKSNCGLLITEETGIQGEKPLAESENPTNSTNIPVCSIVMEYISSQGDEPESHSWKTYTFSIATALLLKTVLLFYG